MLEDELKTVRDKITGPSVTKRLYTGALLMGVATFVVSLIAVSVGPFNVPFSSTVSTMFDLVGIGNSTAEPTEQAVIQSIRLPRIFLAFIVGAALGISGGVMQALFRNSMADPGIIGVSSGGAAGAVFVIALGLNTLSAFFLPLGAFIGSMIAMTVVFFIANVCLLYTSPSPRDRSLSRMPSSA